VPVGPDAARWVTRIVRRTVLVVVHTVVSGQRLLDVVGLIESDAAVQVVYTNAPDVFHTGVESFLCQIGALVISWQQAVAEQFDLVVAAAHGCLHELRGPVLIFPHGAGFAKLTPRSENGRGTAERSVYGLGADHLLWNGRLVPASIVLSHDAQRELLARQCPAAVDIALVAGDPCYDLLLASLGKRADYRAALGVRDERRLVVIASTWGRHSLMSRRPDLLRRLARQLDPRGHRLVVLVHPAAWFGHGRRQVMAWFTDERAAGVLLIEPEADWRAVIVAADHVIGDHGSATTYAAAIGTPVLHTDLPIEEIDRGSPQWYVGATTPLLRLGRPVEPQLAAAAASRPRDWARSVASRLTSRPLQSHRLVRAEMYRLLGLPVPGRHRAVEPVAVPRLGGDCRYV
jgi:hypothetical protein